MTRDQRAQQGIERYIAGDREGAVRLWLDRIRECGTDVQLEACLAHVRGEDPDLLERMEQTVVAVSPRVGVVPALGPWQEGRTIAAPVESALSGAPGWHLVGIPRPTPPTHAGESLSKVSEEMEQRMALHDFTGALELAESICQTAPGHVRASAVRAECRGALTQLYANKVGDLSVVPRIALAPDEVVWLGLDHRAGFVLSQIDGQSTYDEILDVVGMERLDALRILAELCEAGVIVAQSQG